MTISLPPEPENIDALLAQVCRLHYVRAHTLLEEIGVYRGQPPVLFLLQSQDGLALSDLVAHLQVAPATVTKMVQRLERAGFVYRIPDAQDQRVTRIYLTESGRSIQDAMRRTLRQLEEETFAGLSQTERDQLYSLLARLRHNLQRVVHPEPEATATDSPGSRP